MKDLTLNLRVSDVPAGGGSVSLRQNLATALPPGLLIMTRKRKKTTMILVTVVLAGVLLLWYWQNLDHF